MLVEHFRFGFSRQDQLGLFDDEWKVGPYGGRVEADGSTQLGIPKDRIVDSSGPGSLHDTHETVLTFHGGFVTVPSKDQNLGIARDGFRRRAPRQRYLCIAIRHHVLLNRSHARIRRFGVLRLPRPRAAQHDCQHEDCKCDRPDDLSLHGFLLRPGILLRSHFIAARPEARLHSLRKNSFL